MIQSMATEARENGARMVVFPELATTGYVFDDFGELERALANGNGVDEILDISRELGIVLVAGFADIRVGEALNMALVCENGVLLGEYVKTHLWNTEKELFAVGNALPPVVETSIGRVAPAICYDLEFPELMRHCALNGADIVAAPTNWPAGFEAPTHSGPFNGELLRAMAGASANRMYLAIACRTGEERGVDWVDNSCVVDLDGYPITALFDGIGIAYADIDTSLAREKAISPRNDVLTDRRTDLY
jgi:predicted amidohydrolase